MNINNKLTELIDGVNSGDIDTLSDLQRELIYLRSEIQALRIHDVSGRSEQLYLCPVCNEIAGKSYLLSKLPTICQKCDHAWNRA